MDEPGKQHQGKDSFFDKIREKARLNRGTHFIGDHATEIVSGVCVFLGLILIFFYIHWGAALVGLGIGICFSQEICRTIARTGVYYNEMGLFRTLLLIATMLFFLIALPTFVIALGLGCGAMYFIRRAFKT
jgi:hypothetical protein